MRDLSLHILDLAENSVRAGASLVEIGIDVTENKRITLTLRDNGCGMSREMLERVTSPFTTSRTTRKVGLGIPLMMQNAQLTGGDVTLESEPGKVSSSAIGKIIDQYNWYAVCNVRNHSSF